MFNQVIIMGNLGRDPEVRQTANGVTVATLSVATSERVKKGEEWVEETEWHRVVCFGRTAENVGRFKKKGETVHVVGRLRTNKWKDKEGNDRYTTEIIAESVRFVGGGGKSGGGSGGASSSGGGDTWEGNTSGGGFDDGSDIPF